MLIRFLKIMTAVVLVVSANTATAKNCRLTIYFDLDRSDLTPQMQLVLMSFMLHNPRAYGYIVGHTDALGSQRYNMDLSKRRAVSVLQFIEEHGSSAVSLAADWRGKMELVVNTPSAEQLNRRVEIYYKNCTPVTFFAPLPAELSGFEAPYEGEFPGAGYDNHGSNGSTSNSGTNGVGSISGSTSTSVGSSGPTASASGENTGVATGSDLGTSAGVSSTDGSGSASASDNGTAAAGQGSFGPSSGSSSGRQGLSPRH